MLDETHVSARSLLVVGLWTLCLTTWAASCLLSSDDLGRLSIIICGAAATVSVKRMFIEQREELRCVAAVTSTVITPVASPLRTKH